MSMKCEYPLVEITVYAWLLYDTQTLYITLYI